MEKITEERTVVNVKYKSFDGKVFDNEYDCISHEKSVLRVRCLNNIESSSEAAGYPPIDGERHNPDDSFYWFKPKTRYE